MRDQLLLCPKLPGLTILVLVAFLPTTATAQSVSRWKLELVHTIGGTNDPHVALTAAKQVLVAHKDRILIAQPADHNVLVYNVKTGRVDPIGRKGRGPGEFESIDAIGLRLDTLYVADDGLRRMTFFSLDGTYLRSVTWASPAIRTGNVTYLPTVPRVLLPDGSGLVEPTMIVRLSEPSPRFQTKPLKPLLRIDREGHVLDTLLWREPTPGVGVEGPDGRVAFSNPFYDGPLNLLMLDGSGVVTIERRVGNNAGRSAIKVRKLGSARSEVFSRSIPFQPVRMSSYVIAHVADEVLQRLQRAGRGERELVALTASHIEVGLRKSGKVPAMQLPVTDATPTQDGSVWLKREKFPERIAIWTVLDATGRVTGEIQLPTDQTVVAATADIVLTASFDALDVPVISVYRLRKS